MQKLPITLHWFSNAEKSQSLPENKVLFEQILNSIVDLAFVSIKSRTCQICNITFSRMYNLKLHIENHFLPTQVECDICQKIMVQSSLVNHDGVRIDDGLGFF